MAMKFLKWTGITVLVVILLFAATVAVMQGQTYDAPYPEITASKDSAVIARGKYLFMGPAHCMDCHVNRTELPEFAEMDKIPPTGGFRFVLPIGSITTTNLTADKETGIGNLTDKQIARSLRYGVGHDGRAMLDFMPFHNTSDEDLTAIISYLRTIEPVKNATPPAEYNLLGKIVKAFMLRPVGPEGEVPKTMKEEVSAEYGEYLANSVANCKGCHTNRDMMTGAYIGPEYAGGLHLDVPGKPGILFVTRNLTPELKTGHIVSWTKEQFIERFRKGRVYPDSPMPWEPFQMMSDDNLSAIYLYLQTLKPIRNDVGPVIVMVEKTES
jgi:mono/diheme cytochrome c family protein